MFLLRSSYFIFLSWALLSCKHDNKQSGNTFYNIDSLLTVQQSDLAESKPLLFKKAKLGSQLDSMQVSGLDSKGWSTEFEIFRQLDLNKKSFNRENYTIQQGIQDPYSNLLICEYKAKTELPVKKVRIYYQDKMTNPRRIEGEFSEQNGLYTSTRNMVMELNTIRNRIRVTHYAVSGGQKMVLGDSVKFEISGTLIH